MALTAIQRKFCEEYVVDYNIAKAYARATDNETISRKSAWNMGKKILDKSEAQEYIKEIQKQLWEAQFVNYERIAGELATIAFHSESEKNRLQALSLLQKQLGLEKTVVSASVNQSVDIKVGIVDDNN